MPSVNQMTDSKRRKMGDANCREFLAFCPTERPKWRSRIDRDFNEIPTISEMVRDIVKYHDRYLDIQKDESTKNMRKQVIRRLLVTFLFNIQKEEGIGMNEVGATKEIMEKIDNENEFEGKKRQHSEDEIDESVDNVKIEDTPPSLETFPSIEEEIPETHSFISLPSKTAKETENLYRGYKHLINEIRKAKSETDVEAGKDEYIAMIGLIDIQSSIIDTHRILMEELMNDRKSMPGRFSTEKRVAEFQGELYQYPEFEDERYCEESVMTLLDKYNDMVDCIWKANLSPEERLMQSFKCASLFLFSFLTLHPFGDGNGRLARLLASYSLRTFSPFMTPIYNVFSSSVETDYVEALVTCRKDLENFRKIDENQKGRDLSVKILLQKPADLCAMLIESNWTMWRQFLHGVGEDIVLKDWELKNEHDILEIYNRQAL